MQQQIINKIAKDLKINDKVIVNVIDLLDKGNTVPFIARYRKEYTNGLNEVEIANILEKWNYEKSLSERKDDVIRLIKEQGKLTEELRLKIQNAEILQEVEDLYRPYKPKKRTRGSIAKEKGLQELADFLIYQPLNVEILEIAKKFVSEENEVLSVGEALQGAMDIVAEDLSDDAAIRKRIRDYTYNEGILQVRLLDEELDEKKTYEMYYGYEERVNKIVPHRVLAINRGEREKILGVTIIPPIEKILQFIKSYIVKNKTSPTVSYLEEAAEDSYKRLIQPSIEREIRRELSEKAEEQAIHIFSENLRNLLLQPPIKGKTVLGVDPAYRTGCKLAVVDETGKVLDIGVIYPTPPKNEIEKSKDIVKEILQKYSVDVIAIGNGTASRETEQFIANTIKEINSNVSYLIVNEAGASVYSASELGRQEFPDLQVEERSAISIARRLQDPLAELVKIDPKSVGVGQYQHDVSQKKLNTSLKFVVETVVNQVGVNVNTASSSLLQYVSGLNKTVAKNIVKYREQKGKFTNREQLKEVPKLGAKTYEQCIGFLRIIDGDEPLDRTSVHPETYQETKELLNYLGLDVSELGTKKLKDKLKLIDLNQTAQKLNLGIPTLSDIIDWLASPERDPRDEISKPILKTDILKIEDIKVGMELQGTIKNVVDFGAFVDIGLKEDGLIHISKLKKGFVKHPLDVVSVGQIVNVWVENIDIKRGRIGLTMIK